jgi:NADPH:quinone reductase-like Zn-dependent oxidoreductase
VKAIQLLAHGAPGRFGFHEVPSPAPGPGEVLVRVRFCGVNRLDLWLEAGALPIPVRLPRTPGGEIAGEVASLGAEVTAWQPGDRVAVQSNLFCGQCEFCGRGEESLCLEAGLLGVDCDGGFAEFVTVPARALVRLPATVSYETSAALTLAGSTAMHMLTDRATVRAGDWVLVIGGASGVGSAAIQIARGLGARVLATGSNAPKRALALRLGAEAVVDSTAPDWPAQVRKLTARRGADLAIEHVGGAVLEQVFHCLARGGTVVTCGATAGREPRLNLWPFFAKQQRLIGSYGRTRQDMTTTLDWAATGRLQPVIDRVVPLEQAAEALAALRERRVLGKVLLRAMPDSDLGNGRWEEPSSGPRWPENLTHEPLGSANRRQAASPTH